MATKPFLKWAGGKTRVAPNILPHLKGATRLVEPFAGSCALYLQSDVQDALLCDVNPDLIRLYQTLKKHKGAFIDWVETTYFQTKNSLEDFMSLRARFNEIKDIDVNELDSGTSWERSGIFIYLNRHAFNGMCRYNKSGGYNVPYGKYKSVYFPRFEMEAFFERAKHVTFKCQSFQKTLADEIKTPRTGTMIYCDPPYIELSQTASFTAYATDGFPVQLQEELAILAYKAAKAGMPTLISNHDVDPARRLYEKARTFDDTAPLPGGGPASLITNFDVRRSISAKGDKRGKAPELLAIYR